MNQSWFSWVYRIDPAQKEKEPFPGQLNANGEHIFMPPLEQLSLEEGICLLPAEAELRSCRRI